MVDYGKLRQEDIPLFEKVVTIFKDHNLHCGLHGTSLWNAAYKDVDLLVISQSNDVSTFRKALDELQSRLHAEILEEKGNESAGLDYDIKLENMILHVSYVVLL